MLVKYVCKFYPCKSNLVKLGQSEKRSALSRGLGLPTLIRNPSFTTWLILSSYLVIFIHLGIFSKYLQMWWDKILMNEHIFFPLLSFCPWCSILVLLSYSSRILLCQMCSFHKNGLDWREAWGVVDRRSSDERRV